MSDELKVLLNYDETFSCVQCGYCLPACPTYKVMEKESGSPRGRIALAKAAAEGKIDVLEDLQSPIDLCLGCRACETVCPTQVQYGSIYEGAKIAIAEQARNKQTVKPSVRRLRNLFFEGLFPHPRRLKYITSLIWAYQSTGLQKIAHKTGMMNKLPFHLGEFDAALPKVPSPAAFLTKRNVVKSSGTTRMTVAFFAGCMMDSLFYETNRKSIELLVAAGCDVIVPSGQSCCGALHAHAGEADIAKRLAKQNIEAFEESEADFYVNNAGGCGAMLVEYGHLFRDNEEWHERAERFADKSRDINAILAALAPLPFKKQLPVTFTYQDSCHLRNVQKIQAEPRQLLKSIPGAEYVELPGADGCCGSAGIYSLVHYDTSMKILDAKMESVEVTKAEIVVTSNPGCLLQMRMGIKRAGLQDHMEAVHIVDLLHEACGLA